MGFGFNLFLIFAILPASLILIVIGSFSQNKLIGKILLGIWLFIVGLVLFVSVLNFFISKMTVKRQDIFGSYIIDRSKFSGYQSDWQYNHFRFEITEQGQLIFYQTERENIIHIDTIDIEILEVYANDRLALKEKYLGHHIVHEHPTLFRNNWSFYYVFNSTDFGNVFFTKGDWKPID